MDIKYKLKLVEVLRLRPADIELIPSINLSDSCLELMMNGNYDALAKELDCIVVDEKVSEKTRLIAASLKSLLSLNRASDELDAACNNMLIEDDSELEDTPVEETWESKMYREKQGDSKKNELSFKEAKKMLKDTPVEDLTAQYCEFIMQKFPQLRDGFDNGLYRMGMGAYHEHIGINGKEYFLPTEINQKVYFARRGVMDGLNKIIDDIFLGEIDKWESNYKTWLSQRNETRVSKKSIKTFFEEQGKHVSDKVLDRVKMDL